MKAIHQSLQIDNSLKTLKRYHDIESSTSKRIAAIAEGVLSPRSFSYTKKQLTNPIESHHFFGDKKALEEPYRIYQYLNDIQDEIIFSSKLEASFPHNDTELFSNARPKSLRENYNRVLRSYEDFEKEKKTFYPPCKVLVREVRIFEAFQKYESNNHEQFSPYFFPEKINFALSTDVSRNFTSFSKNVLAKVKEVTYSGNFNFSETEDYDKHLKLTVTRGVWAKFGRVFDLDYMKKITQ